MTRGSGSYSAAAAETWEMLAGIIQAGQMIPPTQRAAPNSLPLTVIGGFLGAGKSTLMNQLLSAPNGRKIAVLVNDFGRINIDAELIRSRTADTISLTNGCACCSVAGDLTRALIELAARAEPPDAIVLEASGLADPRAIAQVALANPALRLDGILAIVDAETGAERACDPDCRDTFFAQLAAADLIVLNKLDLLDATEQAATRSWLKAEWPDRSIVETVQALVPVDVALGINTLRPIASFPSHGHAAGFESWAFTNAGLLAVDRVEALLGDIPVGVLRAKAILWLANDPEHRTIYQRVGRRSNYSQGSAWDGETPSSSLVLIGTKGAVDAQAMTKEFRACCPS